MSSPNKHRIAQLVLLFALALISIGNITLTVNSQTCLVPRYDKEPFHFETWVPGTKVTVKIDAFFSEPKASGIEAGNILWNNPMLLCSGVTFNDFYAIVIPNEDLEDTPPRGHLVWQEDDPLTGFSAGVFMEIGFGGFVESARIKVKPDLVNIANGTFFNYLGTHEVGHTFNLKDCISTTGCPTWTDATIMTGHADGITSPASFNSGGPKTCDLLKVRDIYCSPSPTQTPTPSSTPTPEWPWPEIPTEPEPCQNGGWFWNFSNSTCNQDSGSASCPNHCIPYNPLESGGCNNAVDYCAVVFGCPPGTVDGGAGCCCFPTPIIIDVNGDGFWLTDKNHGVHFDMGGDGRREPISWSVPGTDDAWLVLDRNANNLVDNSKEMFGLFTDQPHATTTRNGFVALAEFDRNDSGGNNDGKIDNRDAVFANLRLWQDQNHDGVSQANELKTLPGLGLAEIELNYKEFKRTDDFGNRFRYRAKVKDIQGAQIGRWAYDVFLTTP